MRRRFFPPLAFLAGCLIVAGCGSSSNPPPPSNNARLNGTYVFVQQVYTYYSWVGYSARQSNPVKASMRELAAKATDHTQALNRPFSASLKSAARLVPAQGSDPNYTGIVWGAMVGSLTFDGNGNVTGGEIDFNEPEVGYFHDTVTGAYRVDTDNTGNIRIVSKTQGALFYFDIALQGSGDQATGAQLMEAYADYAGNVEIGTGTMLQQSSGIAQSSLKGNYVFGMQGESCWGCSKTSGGDLYAAGLLASDGSGNFAAGSEADVADGFATENQVPLSGTYGTPDDLGRTVVSLDSGGVMPQNYVLYVANPSTVFVLATDTSKNTAPAYLFGQAGLQSGSFSNATLSGNYVFAENTEDLKNENQPDSYSDAYLALLTAGGGVFSGTGDTNMAGKMTANVPYNFGGYSVAPNGRVTFAGTTPSGAPAPVIWLQNASFGYGVDQLRGNTTLQQPGLIYLYQQPVGTGYSAATLKGPYALGTLPAATSDSILFNAALTSDGVSKLSGSSTVSYFGGYGVSGGCGCSADASYTISPNGRGTITGTEDSIFGGEILYTISGTQALVLDETSGDIAPSIQTIQP